jgi:hypothetical protein
MSLFVKRLMIFVIFMSLSRLQAEETPVMQEVMIKHQKKAQERITVLDILTKKHRKKSWSPIPKAGDLFMEMVFDLNGGSLDWIKNYDQDLAQDQKKDLRHFGGGIHLFYGPLAVRGVSESWKVQGSYVNWKHDSLQLGFRLLGHSSQSTQLTFYYAYEKGDHKDFRDYEANKYGLSSTLYVTKYSGIDFEYFKRFKQRNETATYTYEGYDSTVGFFWELANFRFTVQMKRSQLISKWLAQGVKSDEEMNGALLGFRLYY